MKSYTKGCCEHKVLFVVPDDDDHDCALVDYANPDEPLKAKIRREPISKKIFLEITKETL